MKNIWRCRKSSRASFVFLALILSTSFCLRGSNMAFAEDEPTLDELNDKPSSGATGKADDDELESVIAEDDAPKNGAERLPENAVAAEEKKGDSVEMGNDLEGIIDDDAAPQTAKAAEIKPKEEPEDLNLEALDEPAPPVATEPAARKVAEVAPVTAPTAKNRVTNLEFRMDGPVSKISVTFEQKPVYREVKQSQVKQVIYFFDSTETPQKFQRAYDTTEFPSPVALFTLLQMPGETPLSKLILQLREDKNPTVTTSDNHLFIEFQAPDGKYEPKLVVADEDGGAATEENIYAGGKKYTGDLIKKLEMKNSDVQDALRYIARTSGYSIVVGDDVNGKIGTLSLTDVPWDQAFALVLQSKKLGYIRQGNVIRVGTLTSLKAEKEEALANENQRIKVEPLRTVLIPMGYAKAQEIAPKVKSFLTERGTIDTDPRTNTVIVKDIEKVVNRVQKLLSTLDTQPPRVSIAAKIVEIQNKFNRTIGFESLSFNENFQGLNLNETAQFPGVSGSSITTLTVPQWANLTQKFHLGEAENKVRVLANPSVSVVANQQATVNQSLSFFVQGIETVNGAIVSTLRQITANLSLDVTPIVSGDGSIFMTVNVRNEIPTGIGADRTIDTRAVSTQVLVENGDTAVIGGVFNNTVSEGKSGIPGLMNVPILGFFFSRGNFEDNRNEIFIFLTAKITNAEEAFKRTL
ncbi:MAG: secretin and TonB N-terminal domain-containing protein [Deltaproteobacteria bacterium]|nr:secretin and TonB N-terminal domain-containing protein [Deltaproteobacteria bacterium]MBI3293947.1 secretin and TonB N-terminal domain-containing protein [Deltaproteobacteria bacterium]